MLVALFRVQLIFKPYNLGNMIIVNFIIMFNFPVRPKNEKKNFSHEKYQLYSIFFIGEFFYANAENRISRKIFGKNSGLYTHNYIS